VLLSSQNAATLQSAQMLLRTLTANPKLSDAVDTAQLLEDVLEDIGFGGLWRSSTFHAAAERDRHCTVLTDKLIEVKQTFYHAELMMLTCEAYHHMNEPCALTV
jgi:neurofibromin 1